MHLATIKARVIYLQKLVNVFRDILENFVKIKNLIVEIKIYHAMELRMVSAWKMDFANVIKILSAKIVNFPFYKL